MDAEKLKEIEAKALAAVEKHVEALASELVVIAKEAGEVAIEDANPLVKIVFAASKEQIVEVLKVLIAKLDLNKDGK